MSSTCEDCGAKCCWDFLDTLCWGEVSISEYMPGDEGDDIVIHSCEGHYYQWYDEYTPENK